MAANAVELQVPDFEGSRLGTNPFHVWLDACAYGIGGGLFQGSSLNCSPDMPPPTHYQTMGLPTWCTKQEIERRYQELKRKHEVAPNHEVAVALQEAYQNLYPEDKRTMYDESVGLATKRRSRLDLRPLGFFSKSLSKAQQNWTTWERELLVVVEMTEHFRSVIAGSEVIIHTDHLNNTLLNLALSHPDKILRMLLKIEALIIPR